MKLEIFLFIGAIIGYQNSQAGCPNLSGSYAQGLASANKYVIRIYQ